MDISTRVNQSHDCLSAGSVSEMDTSTRANQSHDCLSASSSSEMDISTRVNQSHDCLSAGSVSEMDINIPPGSLGLFVNATPTRDNDAVALSQFNLTSPAGTRPVVIRITPRQPSKVDVFLRRDQVPTTTDYDWLLRSWDNTDNYTLYLESDQLTDTTQLYIGVRSVTGIY